jgi:hypothetical protein
MNDHREKYGALVDRLGFVKLREIVRLGVLGHHPNAKQDTLRPYLVAKLAEDEHLNTIPLNRWDRCHRATRQLFLDSLKEGERGAWSLSATVCTLKETARQIAEGKVPHGE